MDTNRFNRVVADRIQKIESVLANKAKEYSSGVDRLHNFRVAALLGQKPITPEQALFGMMRKHLVSLIDIIEATSKGEYPSDALRDEKVGDTINYTILLEALLIERKEADKIGAL